MKTLIELYIEAEFEGISRCKLKLTHGEKANIKEIIINVSTPNNYNFSIIVSLLSEILKYRLKYCQ